MKISIFKILSIALVVFITIVFFLALNMDKRYSTEAIVGKKIDNFEIDILFSNETFKNNDLTDEKYHLINIWASWCLPCKIEHPILMNLSKENNLKLIGINFKDKKINAINFLNELGNPYNLTARDSDGTTSVLFGVYGVPESILINKEQIIIKKFVGPIDEVQYNEIIKTIN